MEKMYKNCLIFRTNFYSESWHEFLLELNNYAKVVVVADVRSENYIYSGVEQVSFSRENIESVGLVYDEEVQWRCGDFAYYLAYQTYKFDFAWMIEPDCFFNGFNFHDLFSAGRNVDFISTYISKASDDWYWKKLSVYGEETYRCFFPVTRVSRLAVHHLYNKRKKSGSYMNDESFVISEVIREGLLYSELNEVFPSVKYNKNNFSYRKVHYRKFLLLKILFGRSKENIYHPVYFSLITFLCSFFKKKTWKIMLGIDSND